MSSGLQFVPFSSSLDQGFWHILSTKKLDEFKLSEGPVPVRGFYSCNNAQGIPCLMQLDYTAFAPTAPYSRFTFSSRGTLKNTNTLEQFKALDLPGLLSECGSQIWSDITGGQSLNQPSCLTRFVLITFANLKKFQYHYWFGFAALSPPEPIALVSPVITFADKFSAAQVGTFMSLYDDKMKIESSPFFVLRSDNSCFTQLFSLSEAELIKAVPLTDLIFVFCDPSTSEKYPGWPLRNYLCLISKYFVTSPKSRVQIMGLRDRTTDGKRSIGHSIVFEVELSPIADSQGMWKVVGWEKNPQQKLSPRFVNLSKSMDPERLAESAVDLNLKLMKWRLLPDLDLTKIAETKCLLLGAGTLGCNVARNLLGWGVRTITLVDNSTVSYSNPVRQSLFEFADCLDGGKSKAEAAGASLKRIFPGVKSFAVSLSIPMPGHPVSEGNMNAIHSDLSSLEHLIEDHDAIFLLMDTRESRWLPTMIGAAKNKIVLTAALGFDTWLAMRHGSRASAEHSTSEENTRTSHNMTIPSAELGCYYCNDVVAPRDSTQDRTLDQQCTVSRPGLSMLCSALIVELFISILQHPLGGAAPAQLSSDGDEEDCGEQCILGVLPHQIRGFLSRYQVILPTSRRFNHCSACSEVVLDQYKMEGHDFLLRVFNEPNYLEDICGLTKLQSDPLGMEVLSDFDATDDDW